MTAWNVIGDFFVNLFSFDQAHPLLFTQFYFWAFFALVFAGMSVFRNKVLLRNTFLFASSLFFYYKTSGLSSYYCFLSSSITIWPAWGLAGCGKGVRRCWC